MGGRGNAATRNSGSVTAPATRENAYGFEVENTNSPEVEFTDKTWAEMSELRAYDAFVDTDLRRRVDDRISDLVERYGDLERYDADLTNLVEHLQNSGVTDDEYWAGYHIMANMLSIKPSRYTVMDSDMVPWDEKYESPSSAEAWANEHDGAYIYDTWTRKYRKIGGKNWRS